MYKNLITFYSSNLTYHKIIFLKLPIETKIKRISIAVFLLIIIVVVDFILSFIPKLQFSFFDKMLRDLKYQDYNIIKDHHGIKTNNPTEYIKKYRIEEIKKYIENKFNRTDYDKFYSEVKYQYGEIQKKWFFAKGLIIAAIFLTYEKFFGMVFNMGVLEKLFQCDLLKANTVLFSYIVILLIYKTVTFFSIQFYEKIMYDDEIALLEVLESIVLEEKFD